jgi:hypothetical protein
MPAAIRAYCRRSGQPEPESVGEIVRCCLESRALRYRWVLSALEELIRHKRERRAGDNWPAGVTERHIEVLNAVPAAQRRHELRLADTRRIVVAARHERGAIVSAVLGDRHLGHPDSLGDLQHPL